MENKKKIPFDKKKLLVKSLTLLLTLLSFVLIGLFIANLFTGDNRLSHFFQEYYRKNKVLTYVLFLVLSPVINLLPGISSMFFISLGNLLFNDHTINGMWLSFSLISVSVVLTSSLMFVIGKSGGRKLVEWFVGKDEMEKSRHLLRIAGKAGLPMMYLLPGFPDDTLALVAGTCDISFLYNFICTLLFRLIGVFTLTFLGSDFIPFHSFTLLQWILFLVACLLFGAFVLILTLLYYRYLRKKEEGIRYLLIQRLPVSRIQRKFLRKEKAVLNQKS